MDAAKREVAEETGLRIRLTGLLGMWMDEYDEGVYPGTRDNTLNVYYHAVTDDEREPTITDDENLEVAWFAPSEIPPDLAFPDHESKVLAAWHAAWIAGDTVSSLRDSAQT